MERREAGISSEIRLPAGASGGAVPRVRRRPAVGTLTAAILVLILVCLALPACGADVSALTDEALALMSAGRYDEALPLQERIAALDPGDAQIRLELGFNYLNHQDDPGSAVRVFSEASDLQPSAKNLAFLAQALIAVDDSAAAERRLRQGIEAEPGYARTYTLLVSLLEKQGRTEDADAVREAAGLAGIALKQEKTE